MNKSTHVISIGARGWQHPGWCNSYYPEDLPSDWRLDFYANEFQQLLLPYAGWSQATAADVEQWLAATDSDFRWFAELPGLQVARSALDTLRALAGLGGRLHGICVDDSTTDARTNADNAPELLAELAEIAPLYRREGTTPIEPLAINHQWRPLKNESTAPRLVIASSATNHSAIQLRGVVEALQTSGIENSETLLFVDGAPPAIDDMRLLQQLAELLSG